MAEFMVLVKPSLRPPKSPRSSNGVSAARAQSPQAAHSTRVCRALTSLVSVQKRLLPMKTMGAGWRGWRNAAQHARRRLGKRRKRHWRPSALNTYVPVPCLLPVRFRSHAICRRPQPRKKIRPQPKSPVKLTRNNLETEKRDHRALHLHLIMPPPRVPQLTSLPKAELPMLQLLHHPPLRQTTRSTIPSRPSAFPVPTRDPIMLTTRASPHPRSMPPRIQALPVQSVNQSMARRQRMTTRTVKSSSRRTVKRYVHAQI